jgi:hypothetical protein
MFFPEPFPALRRSSLLLVAVCLIAVQPVRATDTGASTNAAPIEPAVPAPVFLNREALSELRPEEGNPEVASTSDSSAISNQIAPSSALPTPAISDSPQSLASASLASASTSSADPAESNPEADAPPAGADSNAWKSSYINLVNLLVQRGVLNKKDSGNLITQAQQAATAAPSEAQSQPPATTVASTAGGAANPDDDTVRVDYVPDTVKQQIRDEVRADVMKQARDENWAAPNAVPEWVTRYHVSADVRVRYEGDFFPDGNVDSGIFHNFNAINTGAPFDTGINSVAPNPPTYDVNANRNRFRLRARIGAAVDVGEGFTAGLRIGTGQDDNPVTENQTLGAANNGQGGDFSKYAVWLDRAFLRYELGGTSDWDVTASVGRFDNPFFSSSMIWANEIGFDGAYVQGKYKVADGVTPFLTMGAFPVFNTDFNFATTSAAKFDSEDKYLVAVQGGTTWQITKDVSFKAAGAYYYFDNIEGHVSDPFTPQFSSEQGNTDDSRPSFAQNGNTYIALRDIVPTGSVITGTGNEGGTINQFQYYGLATPFHEVALTAQLDFSQWDPFHISLQGEFVKNVAFDRSDIENNGPPQQVGPVNNVLAPGDANSFVGGDMGYNVKLVLGSPVLAKFLDWNVNLTYRYIESDAVVDGFTDSDFGGPLTGTNLKGFMVGGNVSLSSRVWTSLEWMSSDSVAGPTYKNDLIQFDINAKF